MIANLTRPQSLSLLTANVIGAFVYVMRASSGWRIPEEHGLIPITGEPFAWFAAVAPIVALFFLLNLVWGVLVITRRQWWSGRIWLSTVILWAVAICIDFSHH